MGSSAKVTRVHSFQTHPDEYRHWKLSVDGDVATLLLDIQEENGLREGDYLLKQNSYVHSKPTHSLSKTVMSVEKDWSVLPITEWQPEGVERKFTHAKS